MSYIKKQGVNVTLYEIRFITNTGESCLIKYNDREIWINSNHEIAKGRDWIRIPTWLAKQKGLL